MPDTTPHCVDPPRCAPTRRSAAGKPSPPASALPDMTEFRGAGPVQFPPARLDRDRAFAVHLSRPGRPQARSVPLNPTAASTPQPSPGEDARCEPRSDKESMIAGSQAPAIVIGAQGAEGWRRTRRGAWSSRRQRSPSTGAPGRVVRFKLCTVN
jgi:hypothetical protein